MVAAAQRAFQSARRRSGRLALPLLLLGLLLPRTARAELELELGLFNRFTLKRDEVQRRLLYDTSTQAFAGKSYLAPSLDDIYYSFLARAGVVWKPRKWIALGLSVDSGELRPVGNLPQETAIALPPPADQLGTPTVQTTGQRSPVTANGLPIRDEARDTFFIRQAFVRLQAPETEWFVVDAGRFESELSGGLIYGDYGLGLRLLFDLELLKGKPFRLSSRLLLPTRSWTEGLRSPLLELRGEYVLSLLETIGLSVSFYHDGDDNFGALFVPIISEAAVKMQPTMDPDLHRGVFSLFLTTGVPSRANLAWFTLDANKYFGDLQLSASFVAEVGHLSLDNIFQVLRMLGTRAPAGLPEGDTIEVNTLGFALDLSARYLITEKLALGGFFLYLSGDGNPLLTGGERYGSFLGVVPHLTQTNLFFSGGMNETFSGRQATTSGIDGRGVIAGGLNATWEFKERFRVGGTAAVLFAQESSPIAGGGTFYGQETDLEASVAITSYLRFSLEYDVLWGGNFYAASGVTHKLLCGLDLTYER